MDTYTLLQNYWWFIISLLGALLVFLLFVQGGESMLMHHRDGDERSLLINSLGRKWELTFTTLVTFGGAFFASFPLFYSTSFGGAYWLWMLILLSFVIQAISFEYRRKKGNVYGTRFYDTLLIINGFAGPLLLGVAVATMFFGAEFTVTKSNILNVQAATISTWGPLHGLEALASWKNLLFGLMVLFLVRTLASLYFINNIDDETVFVKQRQLLKVNGAIFVVLFLATMAVVFLQSGVIYDEIGVTQLQEYCYLRNYVEMWWLAIIFLIGVAMVLWGIGKSVMVPAYSHGIWHTGIGTVLVVLTLFLVMGYDNTAYYPSLLDIQSSLTLRNSSSSEFTLTVMSIVSILVPFVVGYIGYCWYKMDDDNITRDELENTDHKY